MNKKITPIRRFQILGLHGDRDINLEFDSPIKILINENGSGKTTVLNTLFNILTEKWFKVGQLDFKTIKITFLNKKELVFDHDDFLYASTGIYEHPLVQELMNKMSPEEIRQLLEIVLHSSYSAFQRNYEYISNLIGINSRVFYEELRRVARSSRNIDEPYTSKKIAKLSGMMKELFPYRLLYFPTYRRVEEELHNLGYLEKDMIREGNRQLTLFDTLEVNHDEQLIQFGMRDVKRRFDRITSNIKESSVEWYSIINGRMLTQLIGGIQTESISYSSIESPEEFRIVLDRVGENITLVDKEHILELISSGEIKGEKYKPLAYFLSNLIQVYDQQRSNDNAIKNFARVVNGYLSDKEVRYNESKVDIQIVNKQSGKEVLLNRLSSGEKQVISIFSRLYLDNSSPYAVFFDEPELSLSMEWQKKLLYDIVESAQCEFLLAATHSPFIFENDLDRFASALDINFLEE